MIPTSPYSLNKRIDEVTYICYKFRDLVEDSIMNEYRKTGFVKPTAGFMTHNLSKGVHFQTFITQDFHVDMAGLEKLRQFNWTYGCPLIAVMVVMNIFIDNPATMQQDNYLLYMMQDPIMDLFKLMKEINKDTRQLEEVPKFQVSELTETLPPLIKQFGHLIEKGVAVDLN